MFLASLLGLFGMAAHESYTTSRQYLERKHPEIIGQRLAFQERMRKMEIEQAKRKKEEQNK